MSKQQKKNAVQNRRWIYDVIHLHETEENEKKKQKKNIE